MDAAIDAAINTKSPNELANFLFNSQDHLRILLSMMTNEDLIVRLQQEFSFFLEKENPTSFFKTVCEVKSRKLKLLISLKEKQI